MRFEQATFDRRDAVRKDCKESVHYSNFINMIAVITEKSKISHVLVYN